LTTLKDTALQYKPDTLGNISELASVPVSMEVHEEEAVNQDGKPYSFKYIIVNEQRYRVPKPVIEQLQTIIQLKPEVSLFKVTKTGTGLGTKYKVEALD